MVKSGQSGPLGGRNGFIDPVELYQIIKIIRQFALKTTKDLERTRAMHHAEK